MKTEPSKRPAEAGRKLSLLYSHEERSDMFLQNVGLSLKCTALQPRGLYSSFVGYFCEKVSVIFICLLVAVSYCHLFSENFKFYVDIVACRPIAK
jgi:hypothetical protein